MAAAEVRADPGLPLRVLRRTALLAALSLYTVFAGGPFLWIAGMSLRTTTEISRDHYGLPIPMHWGKFRDAWFGSNYSLYFWNSAVVVLSAVILVSIVGALAAHGLARHRFRGNRTLMFLIFTSLLFPPQITIISLFQITSDYGLYGSRWSLVLVYVAIQMPLTIYLLEAFYARLPQDLFDAARMDGYSDLEIFFRITLPVGFPALATTIILNFIHLWNEFLYAIVLLPDEESWTLPLGIQKFMGDQLEDYGMIATGLVIAIVPVVFVYAVFSERLIQGMTAGAVK